MREWRRATMSRFCGLCPRVISVGDVLLLITLPGVGRPLVRCTTCVPLPLGIEIPPLPLRPAAGIVTTTERPFERPMTPLRGLARDLVADYRVRQAGGDDE